MLSGLGEVPLAGWTRSSRATTGTYRLAVPSPAGVDDDHQFMLKIVVDGTVRTAPSVEGEPTEEIIAWMLQEVYGEFIERTIGEAWPRLSNSRTHPLVPEHEP